jgi:hypothetical protein
MWTTEPFETEFIRVPGSVEVQPNFFGVTVHGVLITRQFLLSRKKAVCHHAERQQEFRSNHWPYCWWSWATQQTQCYIDHECVRTSEIHTTELPTQRF